MAVERPLALGCISAWVDPVAYDAYQEKSPGMPGL